MKILPKGWKMMKISDVAIVSAGGTPRRDKKEYWRNGTINWLKISDMKTQYISKTEEKITKIGEDNSSTKLFPKGTIVYSIFASLGTIGILDIESTTNQAIAGIIPKKEITSTKYLYYCLQYEKNKIIAKKSHVTQDNLNLSILKNHEILIPPITIQKKIVSVLEKIEKAKELREESNKLTKNFLNSTFLKMFGNPITNSKKWEIKKMGELSEKIVSGTTPKGGKEVYVKNGIVFFRSQNVWKNRLSLDNVAYIDEDTHNKMKKSSLKNKDILMTKTGRVNTENSSLGRSAMFLGKDNSANVNGHVYLIRLQENIIPEFVLFIITTNEYREYIRSVCVGAIDKRQINKEHLQNFPIIFPPVELQKKFVSIVKQVEAMKEQQKQTRIQIHNLFNYLMQKSFKGELVC